MATATTNNSMRLRKAVEALLNNPPHDNDPFREQAPPAAGWHLSGDLWKQNVCAQTHTATVRKALKEHGLIEEKRVTKPSTRRNRQAATTTAIRLRQGPGFRNVLAWLLKDYYLSVKYYYREQETPYFERNAETLAQIKQEWARLIQPVEHLLTPTGRDGRSHHQKVLYAEFFEFYLAHQETATTLMNELTTMLQTICSDAPTGIQHRCRTDFLVRILYGDNLLKQAATICSHKEMHSLLMKEARAFNECLEHNHCQAARPRANDVWA